MRNGQYNEMRFVLSILKSPEIEYNSNNLAKHLKISSMGALKIARKLEKERVLVSRLVGRAKIYKINFKSEYAIKYIEFLLKKEIEQTSSFVKVWIRDLRKIKSADIAILFGSILRKGKRAEDVDIFLVTDKKKFSKLKKEIKEINLVNLKKIHPIYQAKEDLEKNIKKGDKPVLNAIKGLVVFGEDVFINLIEK